MAISEQKRQRKLAKKQAKNSQRHKKAVSLQQKMASTAGRVLACSQGRLITVVVSSDLESFGMGVVSIVRQGPNGMQMLVSFLVDAYCLGVKDVLVRFDAPSEIEDCLKQGMRNGQKTITAGYARGLVEGAVEFARQSGFEPHHDYRKVVAIWGDTEPEPLNESFQFGKNGKPLYMSGPSEDPAEGRLILAKLEKNIGIGNFDFILLDSGQELELFRDAEFFEAEDEVEDWRDGSIDGEVRRIDS